MQLIALQFVRLSPSAGSDSSGHAGKDYDQSSKCSKLLNPRALALPERWPFSQNYNALKLIMVATYDLCVRSNIRLTPNMRRIVLEGEPLVGFPENQESGYVKLLFQVTRPIRASCGPTRSAHSTPETRRLL